MSEGGKVAIADLDAEAGAALVSQLGEDRAAFFHCDVKCVWSTKWFTLPSAPSITVA